MFHPASRHTKWTRLHLGDPCIDTIELQIMRRFLGSQNGSEVFRCIASSAEKYVTEYPVALGPPATESFGTPRGYVIHLATLAKRTQVYAVSRPAVARCTAKQTKSGTRVYPTAAPGTFRLTVDGPGNSKDANWKLALPLLSTTISQERKGLRVIEIEFSKDLQLLEEVDQFTAQLPPSQPGLAMGKLTFLWAFRTWRPRCAAALESYVIAMIYGFCGRSMERVVITSLPDVVTTRLPLRLPFSLVSRHRTPCTWLQLAASIHSPEL